MKDPSSPVPVRIQAAGVDLDGDLFVPVSATGIVLFAHGSGSSRSSPRNRDVARTLQSAGFATLLLDLLTVAEDEREQAGGRLRFDVAKLATRLSGAVEWLAREPSTRDLPLGIFGASTGAASALIAAADQPARVRAVVSRGGRPDLAGGALAAVHAPTLLIVGGADHDVIGLNREALAELQCTKRLVLVPGATHLFEERGALKEVAALANGWFQRYLPAAAVNSQGLERARTDPEY